jgi:thiol:disulfide interchange protein DsbA
MKRLLFVITLTALVAVGCGKQEAEEALVEDASIAEELAADTAEGASPVAESESESVIVVEESAAEAEPEDQSIVLARADEIEAPRNWKYKEGTNFTRMIPTQPTVGGADKIEVAEVFMYSCPHCQSLEPHINRWAETKDPNVRFVRIPAVFNQRAVVHAQH